MAETRTPEQIAYDDELAKIEAMPAGVMKIKARDAFDKKYPNGRPGGAANSANTVDGAAEALAFGITESLIKAFPELQPIYDLFVARRFADARLAYYNSDYYKNLTTVSADRRTKKATQPGVYAQEFDAWKQAQKIRMIAKGVKWNTDIENMLEDSYLRGDSDVQLDIKVLNSGKMGSGIGGSTLGVLNQLKDIAYDQGVNTTLSQSYWDKIAEGLFAGTTTVSDVEQEIKNIAISAFPAYAKGIEAGRSFNLQTSALRQTIANLLEVDVDTVTNDNPIFKQLVGYVNPKTNTPEAIPLWEAEKIVKSKDEWNYTKNARDTYDTLGLKVLRDWGIA